MKLEDFLKDISKDLKEVRIQTTRTNGRVSVLEEYNDEFVKPMVREFTGQQAVKKYTLKQKAFRWSLATAFGVALLGAVWSAGYWAFETTIDRIVNKQITEEIDGLKELLEGFENIELEIEY